MLEHRLVNQLRQAGIRLYLAGSDLRVRPLKPLVDEMVPLLEELEKNKRAVCTYVTTYLKSEPWDETRAENMKNHVEDLLYDMGIDEALKWARENSPEFFQSYCAVKEYVIDTHRVKNMTAFSDAIEEYEDVSKQLILAFIKDSKNKNASKEFT